MDDLFFNLLDDQLPFESLIEEDRPSMVPVFNEMPNEPPFLLDDGIIPDSDEAFFAPPPPRKRRFMDHRTSIFTIVRDTSAKETAPNHNKFLEKRRRAVALRMNAQSSSDSSKQLEQPQTTAPRVIKKIEQKMRNRISAQQSRDRKKGYINILERQNADLRKENRNLRDELEALQDEISKMREKCAVSTAGSGAKTTQNGNNNTQSNGGSGQSSNNGSQNQSHTMSEDGNQSEQNSEAIFQAADGDFQRHTLSGNSLFLSLFSVLSVCAMIAITTGPNGMHADGLHAQADRLRVLAAMQPRCAGYGEQTTEVQALYEKVHRLTRELNSSKFENMQKKCAEPEIKQCPSLLNATNAESAFKNSNKSASKFAGKQSGKTNNLRTAVMEYKDSNRTAHNATNSTNATTGTLFCPSGVIVASVMHSNMMKKEPVPPLVSMGTYEALKGQFEKDSLLQIILPTTNLTVLRQVANGKSEITQFGNKEDKLIEMVCVIKGMSEVS